MRKSLALALAFVLAALTVLPAAAAETTVTRAQLLTGYFSALFPSELAQAKRPTLSFPDLGRDAELEAALEKAVFFGLLPNSKVSVKPGMTATDRDLALLLSAHWGLRFPSDALPLTPKSLSDALAAVTRLGAVRALRIASVRLSQPDTVSIILGGSPSATTDWSMPRAANFSALDEEFKNLRTSHYDAGSFTDEELIYGAAKGMAEATKDKWATFFPPEQSKQFQELLTGQYEGVGAYVDMLTPGDLRVVSPIVGSPAEKAGIKSGDRIVKIGDTAVGSGMTLGAAIALIKGPADSKVTLVVDRAGASLTFVVTRQKISIKFVNDRKLDESAYYVQVTEFGVGVAQDFLAALRRMDAANPTRVVIDLRNNPGGSLDEVADMLSQLVPKGEPTVVVKYRDGKSVISSRGGEKSWFGGRTVTVLTNGGSASASEIMAGTLRDYYPTTLRTVGEKTYGKGSVQTQLSFDGGSSIKFTVAKWFTGKSETGIDGVGIPADLEVKPVAAATGSTAPAQDDQLEYGKSVRF